MAIPDVGRILDLGLLFSCKRTFRLFLECKSRSLGVVDKISPPYIILFSQSIVHYLYPLASLR